MSSPNQASVPGKAFWPLGGLQKKALFVQGVPKKMQHSDFLFRSVPEVQFNIFTCVSESEF